LDLQADLIATPTRVVAPLIALSDGPRPISRLEPILSLDGKAFVLHTAEMAAIPKRFVSGEEVADFSGSDYEIRLALDMVFSGF